MRASPSLALVFLLLVLSGAAFSPQEEQLRETAGEATTSGILVFEITDEAGTPQPCRLTFVPADDPSATPDLFPEVDAAQGELAVRKNVVYSLSGRGHITVPVGRYNVYATRGIEWSRAQRLLEFEPGVSTPWSAALRQEVNTDGWVSGDFHLHTLTYSGHGDSNLTERIISLIGEGVEFAVATDHNHNTDYGPTIRDIGATARITAVVGNEVSTPIGHFNAFPLDPTRPVIDSGEVDANQLFQLIRDEPNAEGIVPIVQLNHPRWDGIDYFAQTGFDPVTGTSPEPAFSYDFDSIEVMNENASWGYFEKYVSDIETSGNRHSVLQDWFHLLDRGHRSIAVGNSDSHTVHKYFAGYPRNMIFTGSDDPGAIDPKAVAAAIRGGRVVATSGPILNVTAGEVQMGGLVTAVDGKVRLEVDVQCASWIACDRLKVVVNGETIQTIELPERVGPLHAVHSIELAISGDSWVVLLAEGDTSLAPIVLPAGDRPALPLAIANPLRIDADGDGSWTSPFESTRAAIAGLEALQRDKSETEAAQATSALFDTASGAEAARLILASQEMHADSQETLAQLGLASPSRRVQLAAARSLEQLGEDYLAPPDTGVGLQAKLAWKNSKQDPYLDITLARALLSTGLERSAGKLIAELYGRHGSDVIAPYMQELLPFLAGTPVTQWRAVGYFDAPTQGTIRDVHLGPEEKHIPNVTLLSRDGGQRAWLDIDATADGHLDLRRLAQGDESTENCFAYAETWIKAPSTGDYLVGLGTDDGGRVYLNDTLFHEDLDRQGASPLQHVKSMPLHAGWNRVLFQVENGGGAYGLYFQLLEAGLESARQPDL